MTSPKYMQEYNVPAQTCINFVWPGWVKAQGFHVEGNTKTKKGYLVNLILLPSYFLVCVANDYVNHLHCMRLSLFRYRT